MEPVDHRFGWHHNYRPQPPGPPPLSMPARGPPYCLAWLPQRWPKGVRRSTEDLATSIAAAHAMLGLRMASRGMLESILRRTVSRREQQERREQMAAAQLMAQREVPGLLSRVAELLHLLGAAERRVRQLEDEAAAQADGYSTAEEEEEESVAARVRRGLLRRARLLRQLGLPETGAHTASAPVSAVAVPEAPPLAGDSDEAAAIELAIQMSLASAAEEQDAQAAAEQATAQQPAARRQATVFVPETPPHLRPGLPKTPPGRAMEMLQRRLADMQARAAVDSEESAGYMARADEESIALRAHLREVDEEHPSGGRASYAPGLPSARKEQKGRATTARAAIHERLERLELEAHDCNLLSFSSSDGRYTFV